MAKKTIWVEATLRVTGLHHYRDADGQVDYLRNPHRHIFIITARKRVTDKDREVEFFDLQKEIQGSLFNFYRSSGKHGIDYDFDTHSCEEIAFNLCSQPFPFDYVKVSEDGENAAIVEVR